MEIEESQEYPGIENSGQLTEPTRSIESDGMSIEASHTPTTSDTQTALDFNREEIDHLLLPSFEFNQIKAASLGLYIFLKEIYEILTSAILSQELSSESKQKLSKEYLNKNLETIFIEIHNNCLFHWRRIKTGTEAREILLLSFEYQEIQTKFEQVWGQIPRYEQRFLNFLLNESIQVGFEGYVKFFYSRILEIFRLENKKDSATVQETVDRFCLNMDRSIPTLIENFLNCYEGIIRVNASQTSSIFHFLTDSLYDAEVSISKLLLSIVSEMNSNVLQIENEVTNSLESNLESKSAELKQKLNFLSAKGKNLREREGWQQKTINRIESSPSDKRMLKKVQNTISFLFEIKKFLYFTINPLPIIVSNKKQRKFGDVKYFLAELEFSGTITEIYGSSNGLKGLPYTCENSRYNPVIQCLSNFTIWDNYFHVSEKDSKKEVFTSLKELFKLINPQGLPCLDEKERRMTYETHIEQIVQAIQPLRSLLSPAKTVYCFLVRLFEKFESEISNSDNSPLATFKQKSKFINICDECGKSWYDEYEAVDYSRRINIWENETLQNFLESLYEPSPEKYDFIDKKCDCPSSYFDVCVRRKIRKKLQKLRELEQSEQSKDSNQTEEIKRLEQLLEEKESKQVVEPRKRVNRCLPSNEYFLNDNRVKIFCRDKLLYKSSLPEKVCLRGTPHELVAFTMGLRNYISFACVKKMVSGT